MDQHSVAYFICKFIVFLIFRNLAIREYLRANGYSKSLEAFNEEADLVIFILQHAPSIKFSK